LGRPKSAPTLFEIWQAAGRIASIENPVRLKVLRQLEQGPRTLNGLVAATRKSKSTLSSLHLPPLLQTGLVQEAPDPHDGRVKWYVLAGSRLGSSAVDPSELRDAVLGYVQSRGIVPIQPLLDVLRPDDLVARDPAYADEVAQRLGELLGRMLLQRDRSRAAHELDVIVERAGLGHVRWTASGAHVTPKSPALRRFLSRVVETALGAHQRALVA
jgi:DNA-binding transcriptional ArsR family regulator